MNERKKKIFSLIMLAAVFFCALPALGQDSRTTAFLESGPLAWKGMPGIGLNSIPGYRGIYRLSEENKETAPKKIIEVYFTDRKIPFFSSWEIAKPGVNNIYRTERGSIYIYSHFENWTVFIDFRDSLTPEEREVFARIFTEQMVFFTRDGSGFSASSFPAVIELTKD